MGPVFLKFWWEGSNDLYERVAGLYTGGRQRYVWEDGSVLNGLVGATVGVAVDWYATRLLAILRMKRS